MPYGQSTENMLEALSPPDHPDHHSIIGSMADLSAASLDDVSAFFRTYYSPNNASLGIAGDFKPREAKRLVAEVLRPAPGGPEGRRSWNPSVPKLEAEARHDDRARLAGAGAAHLADRRARPRRRAGARRPGGGPRSAPQGEPALRALVFDRQLAVGNAGSTRHSELTGAFVVTITARSGPEPRRAGQARRRADRATQERGPTENEVVKAQNSESRR